jgi:general secretion pathway protein H
MRSKGFSLIEMLVVLILIGFSISLVAPSLSRFSRAMELKGAAKKISGILRYCRCEAVSKGQVYQVRFDTNLREVRVQPMESTYFLPEGVQIKEVQMTSVQPTSDLPMIEFYPNGGSNGGAVLLDSQGPGGYKINVHFLTGVVEVEKVEGSGG